MGKPLPNRVAVYFLVAVGAIAAAVPVLADFDSTSVAGWIAGVGAIATAVYKWLDGWQKFEVALETPRDAPRDPIAALVDEDLGDDFDEAEAELPPAVVDTANADIPPPGPESPPPPA